MDMYIVVMTIVGLAALGMVWLPELLRNRILSYPILFIALGVVLYSLPLELPPADPLKYENQVVRLTELAVIVTLMGTGIKIDRPFSWRRWRIPLMLVLVTMILSIAGLSVLGWWLLGLTPAAAILLGAALAPTDPVLAGDVQVGPPREKYEDPVRFSLTAEAGLNDGMAFPFTWLAIALAQRASNPGNWLWDWVSYDVLYRMAAGVIIGYVVGRALVYLVFTLPKRFPKFPQPNDGFLALAATLLVYGITEMVHGYGFIAVFITGLTIGSYERDHKYHRELHDFTDQIERLLLVIVLIPLGGSIVTGVLFEALTWTGVLISVLFLFVIRPLAGLPAFIGSHLPFREKLAISFFGIRGIGSFFYLSFALHEIDFINVRQLWSITGFTVLLSIVLHGITAKPIMRRLDFRRVQQKRKTAQMYRELPKTPK